MTSITNVEQVKINVMTQAQYTSATKNANELYAVVDAKLDYNNDLTNQPTIGNATLTIQKNGTNVDTFTANATSDKTINITVPTQASDVGALPSSTKYGASTSLSIDSSTYVITLQLKDQDGNNLGNAQTIDLPLESVVVNGSYDSTNKKIILTLNNGNTIDIPVGDLISGLQTEITAQNKLDADLVDDSTSTNKFVTASDKTTWGGKQDALVSGTNIKTINNNSLLGSGDITIDSLPSQSGQSGKFLTTDGTDASWAAISGSVDIDDVTITENSSDKIQAVGTINKNTATGATNVVYDWIGTLYEYKNQNISTLHPEWVCYITDDNEGRDEYPFIPDLFDTKWTDYTLNNASWINAYTFSWQDGGVYEEAYQHLEADISGKSLSSETVAGTTIQFYLADDGHKICPASEENNVATIYAATGVAWYYIIDTTNEQFKLPRINPDKAKEKASLPSTLGVRGNGMAIGVTNGDANATLAPNTGLYSAVFAAQNGYGQPVGYGTSYSSWGNKALGVVTDSSKSGLVADVPSVDSYYSGKKYLYFYVGNFTQTALENTAGLNASLFNGKVDLTSSWGAPSSTYDDLTLGASGSTYTAPADGWFYISAKTSGTNYQVIMGAGYMSVSFRSNSLNQRMILPVSKGMIMTMNYDGTLSDTIFRFIYAQKTN